MELGQSILGTVKQMLGITEDNDPFDNELITHINAVFPILNQLDIGPDEGFEITGYNETWNQLTDHLSIAALAAELIHLKVRMIFDPPASSVVADQYNSRISELEWRINIQAERLAALAEKEAAS